MYKICWNIIIQVLDKLNNLSEAFLIKYLKIISMYKYIKQGKMDLTENQINNIIDNYKKKRDREINYYHNVLKHNQEFKDKCKERSKNHYHNGYKEVKKEKYQENKEYCKAISSYNYYKKTNRLDYFKEKNKDKYDILVEKGVIEKPPVIVEEQ